MENECTLLGTLFQSIVTDLKGSSPAWEDFVNKGTKLHGLLKSTTVAVSAFIESIQKIADVATNTKGSTKDIGSALTRICVRQKMMENKLKHFTNSMMDNLLCPVQDRLEEWKKVANQLEKDHTKDYKRAMHEIKKRNSDTVRLQKKVRKGSKPDLQQQLSLVMHDVNERFTTLEETEKSALRNLLVEERSRMCLFANSLSPVLDLQVSMLNEVSHLHELTSDVARLCRNPKQLPTSTDQLVEDFIAANSQNQPISPLQQDSHANGMFSSQLNGLTPPASPISTDSRKSSTCSLNSINSSDSRSSGSLNRNSSFHHRHYQSYHRRSGSVSTNGQGSPTSCKSAPAGVNVARLSSVSSHDSGFVSTGNGTVPLSLLPLNGSEISSKPPVPLPIEKTDLSVSDENLDGVSPIIRSRPNSGQISDSVLSPSGQAKAFWKDWSKPGPYDNPSLNNTDPRRNVLPSKLNRPPPLSPKPQYLKTRASISGAPNPRTPPPLFHTISEPHFFPSEIQNDENSLPPPPGGNTYEEPIINHDDDPLPPPPPALLTNSEVEEPMYTQPTTNNTNDIPHYACPLPPLHLPTPQPIPHPSENSNLMLEQSHNPPNQTPRYIPSNNTPHYNPQTPVPRYTPQTNLPTEFSSMTLGRKNSSNSSLQYSSSSGYSSQHTTPACSADTIASHETDNGNIENDEATSAMQQPRTNYDYEKYSTLPRNYHHGNNAHGRSNHHQGRRPASTAGIPGSNMICTNIDTPGTATIRRKPSSKFNSVRRTSNAPKPIKPPTVPSNAVANLMSSFRPPETSNYYAKNSNNNNNYDAVPVEMRNGHFEQNCTQQGEVTSPNLTLRLKQGSDIRDGSPTPTMTPTMSECVQSYNNCFHANMTSLSADQQN